MRKRLNKKRIKGTIDDRISQAVDILTRIYAFEAMAAEMVDIFNNLVTAYNSGHADLEQELTDMRKFSEELIRRITEKNPLEVTLVEPKRIESGCSKARKEKQNEQG
jgi:pimeloyl-CoA synthetase